MSIEKKIAHLIEKDFPAYYRDEGPTFVEFIRTYYEWLESQGQTIYHARNLLDYKDIDKTIEDFIVYFKQKYLPNIQFDTATDVQQLIKHTLDLYRSKGTDRSIDLFFRLVYGKPAQIYYPGEDVMRLSDGKWIRSTYLEITSSPANRVFINRQIVGLTSGATAFVERIIRRKIASKYAEIMFISSVNGNFETGEKITIDGEFQEVNPTVIGSMTSLQVIAGGQNFAVGDIVDLTSPNGVQGKGRVADVTNYTGLVEFILIDGGWGYSANADVLVSEKVLNISDVDPADDATDPFSVFDLITQPMANITYDSANSTFAANDVLYSYYSNNLVSGTARILEVTPTSSTNGTMRVSVTDGVFGAVPERNANSAAPVVVSTFSNTITGVVYNTNLSGTVNARLGNRNLQGTGTLFDKDLFRPQANLSGTVSVNSTSNSVVGSSTKFDMQLVTPSANLMGTVYVNATSLSVLGIGTFFNTELSIGEYLTIYSNSTNWETRKIDAITNSTALAVNSAFTFENSTANFTTSVISPHISVYTNSSIYESRSIHEIVNATSLVVKTRFVATNTASNFANSYIAEWISVSNGSYREIRSVNNVVNSTSMWLKWPTQFANSVATVGNVSPSNTKFYVPFANLTGSVSFTAGNTVVVGTGTDFTDLSNGDFVALYSNSTTYEIKTISVVTNATYLTLSNVASFSNSSANSANVTANDSIYFGKTIVFYSNSTTTVTGVVQNVANDSSLTLQSKPTFSNSQTTFANTNVISQFYKAGNSAVANATVYTDTSAVANIIGTKANVSFTVSNNSIRIANDMIIFQTNSTGFEVATAYVITASYSGTNTFIIANAVTGVFQPNSTVRARLSNGQPSTANGVLDSTMYSVGVIDIDNVFKTDGGNFIYTSANTRGVVTRVSQHNVLAGFDISSNSLNYEQTVTFYGDMIEPYADVYLNAENFQPADSLIVANLNFANVDTTLADAFTNSSVTIGGINTLVAINPGTEYDTSPIVLVYEPLIAPANRKDYVLGISNSAGVFLAGEILTQNSATVGIVKYSNSSAIGVKRIRYEDPFNTSLLVEGLASGATANIDIVYVDSSAERIGTNALIEANVVAASGSVVNIDVVDSGVGYIDNETVSFVHADGVRSGVAVVKLGKQGRDRGYYASKGSFLSADKKVFDGHYYQDYSYEIRSPITLDKYESMLRNVLHISGTKFFASVVTPSIGDLAVSLKESYRAISGTIQADTTSGNSIVTTSNTAMLRVGYSVTGNGIPANTKISVINSTAFVMSNTANSTVAGLTVTYTV
jgi:hypothetical protein